MNWNHLQPLAILTLATLLVISMMWQVSEESACMAHQHGVIYCHSMGVLWRLFG